MSFADRLMHAWNAFKNQNQDTRHYKDLGLNSSYNPDTVKLTRGNEKTLITSIYNRIANDCAEIDIKHVRLGDGGRFEGVIEDGLNYCLTVEANVDQTARQFIHDAVLTMLDQGVCAIVPIDTGDNPTIKDALDIKTMRVATITEWYPEHVKVKAYNEAKGYREEVILPKRMVAILENPFYAVMNQPNSTLSRLTRKLALLDAVDEQSSSGKLDLIIQLPYAIKTEARRAQADARRKELEHQLKDSKYGIAYTDGTEKVTQLNRSIENNLMAQIEYLETTMLSQLGLTAELLGGTASDTEMTMYYSRTIEPIMNLLVEEMRRKFLTKTARTKGHTIKYFRDPFKLVPVSQMADLADKLTRNEILTSNEVRQIIGLLPSQDPEADVLRNKNINKASDDMRGTEGGMMEGDASGLGAQATVSEPIIDPETGEARYEIPDFEAEDDIDLKLEELEAMLNELQ